MTGKIASRDAELPTGELVANLRSDVMHRWTPPRGGYHGALNHVVSHGLDVTVPLGVPRRSPDETIRVVLDDLTEGGGHAHFDIDIEGRSLQATDLDWSYGSGRHCAERPKTWDSCSLVGTIPNARLEGKPL